MVDEAGWMVLQKSQQEVWIHIFQWLKVEFYNVTPLYCIAKGRLLSLIMPCQLFTSDILLCINCSSQCVAGSVVPPFSLHSYLEWFVFYICALQYLHLKSEHGLLLLIGWEGYFSLPHLLLEELTKQNYLSQKPCPCKSSKHPFWETQGLCDM